MSLEIEQWRQKLTDAGKRWNIFQQEIEFVSNDDHRWAHNVAVAIPLTIYGANYFFQLFLHTYEAKISSLIPLIQLQAIR